jgi:pSer/pThr/pTyr-binding forkhead associated (FHA) protein
LQVKYPESQPHDVELLGRVSIIGRDPSCDLVVHDVKCSRRHAVLETGPDGVTVRDSGSANGVFVNGQRIERAVLRPGDVIALGEVQLVLLPEPGGPSAEATLMTPAGAAFPTAPPPVAPRPLSPPPAPAPAPPVAAHPPQAQPPFSPQPFSPQPPQPMPPPRAPEMTYPPPPPPVAAPSTTRPRGSYSLSGSTESGKVKAAQVKEELDAAAAEDAAAAGQRPLTVTVLAVLWMASVLLYLIVAVGGLVGSTGIVALVSAGFGVFLALLSGGMALGLWMVKPWARIAQIVIAALGVFTCTFTLPSVVVLVYMFRAGVRARFADGRGPGDPKEGLFTGLLLGTVALGVLLAAAGWALTALGVGSRLQ